jgi:hypothetical protein
LKILTIKIIITIIMWLVFLDWCGPRMLVFTAKIVIIGAKIAWGGMVIVVVAQYVTSCGTGHTGWVR